MAKKVPAKKISSKKKVTQVAAKPTYTTELVDSVDIPENQNLASEIAVKIERPDLDFDPAIETDFETSKTSSRAVALPYIKDLATSDPLAMYLNEIKKYPVLSKEEEAEVAKKYFETKDAESAQILARSNLRFVVKVAAEYSKFGSKMIDLIQEGNVGLLHAIREYNPYKGARLITYAVWWIRGYIQEYLMRQYSMVRIGTTQNQRKLFYNLQKEKDALEALGITPNLALMSHRLGVTEDEIESMSQRMSGRDVSLDRPLDDDSNFSLKDFQKSAVEDETLDDRLDKEKQLSQLKNVIEKLRPQLSEREKIILDERILNDEPLTLQEIGEKHKITREAVRQMEARVLKKIKTHMSESLISEPDDEV